MRSSARRIPARRLLGALGCALLVVACASEAEREPADRELPALRPRATTQTCLAGLPDPPPMRLSETGCFESLSPLTPGPDLVPYEVISQLWTDTAWKQRYLVLPPGETIAFTPSGAWDMPSGSVLVKVFGLEMVEGDPSTRRVVETRVMVRRAGGWSFHSYLWNEEQSEATLLSGGMLVDYTVETDSGPITFPYQYPSPEGCTSCHSEGVGLVLGPRAVQLNLRARYGDEVRNQLEALAEIGVFDVDAVDPAAVAAMPDPHDESAPLADRARAYLHANCSHCHQPGGWTSPGVDMDLRWEMDLAETNTCDVPVSFDLIPGGDYRIAAGDPERSSLWRRMQVEGVGTPTQMPPLGRSTIDPLGRDLIAEWIQSIETCP